MRTTRRSAKRARAASGDAASTSSIVHVPEPLDTPPNPPPVLQNRYKSRDVRMLDPVGRRTAAMQTRRGILSEAIRTAGFPYLHEVRGHRSCINALAFSRGSGQWMASGGDDMRIHVRDLFDYDPQRPGTAESSTYRTHARLLGHTSNIFSLSWSSGNRHLFSGGNDQQVLCYDLNYGDAPAYTIRTNAERRFSDVVVSSHEAGIREVSAHPTNPNLLLSSSDCGELFLVDLRLPDTHVAAFGYFPAQLASAQWNPNESDGRTFAVATVCEPNAGVAYVPALTDPDCLTRARCSASRAPMSTLTTRSCAMRLNCASSALRTVLRCAAWRRPAHSSIPAAASSSPTCRSSTPCSTRWAAPSRWRPCRRSSAIPT